MVYVKLDIQQFTTKKRNKLIEELNVLKDIKIV